MIFLQCLFIFCARICDVTLGTMRTIFVFRGHRIMAGLVGFFEVSIWILASGKVLLHLDEWYMVASYAGGFSMGNILGMLLESKLAIGNELVRIVSENKEFSLAEKLRQQNYHVIEVHAENKVNNFVEVLLIIERRARVQELLNTVQGLDPSATFTTEDLKSVHNPFFLSQENRFVFNIRGLIKRK